MTDKKKMKPRLMRVVDYTAESLEAHANRMPPSYKEQADIWRKTAATLRSSDNPRMVRVWEEDES